MSKLVFSGTAYLGLDRHPQFLQWIKDGLDRYGAHYGGSRRSTIAPTIFTEVETTLATWTGAPAALLVSSGTSAGQLVVRYLAAQHYRLSYSPGVHPALWWPSSLENDRWGQWAQSLRMPLVAGLTDAINPLTLEQAELTSFLEHKNAILVVDDSHQIGIAGDAGQGSWQQWQKTWPGELILTASLGKALSLPAGVILGSVDFIQALKDLPQFGGASPPTVAPLHAFLQAKALIQKQRSQLLANIERVHSALQGDARFGLLADYPVITTTKHELATVLQEKGIQISSFPYPASHDPWYTRMIIRADHDDVAIEKLLKAIRHA